MPSMLKPFFVILLLFISCIVPSMAQELVQRVFSARDGLSTATINDISFGEDGFVWLGTEQGLYRLSNSKIRRVDKTAGESQLFDSYINLVTNIDSDHLLVSSQTRLYIYNIPTNRFTEMGKTSSSRYFADEGVVSYVRQADGQLLLLTFSGKLYRFNSQDFSLQLIHKGKLDDKVNWRHMLQLSDNSLLFASAHTLEMRSAEGELLTSLPWKESYGAIRGLFRDSKGRLWILSSKGLHKLEQATSSLEIISELPYFMSRMLEDKQGNLWIASRKGLILWRPETADYVLYGDELKQRARIDYIHDMAVDDSGIIWVGGSGDGLALIAPQADFLRDVYSKSSKYKLDTEMVWSIYSEGDKTWLGTDGSLAVIHESSSTSQGIIPPGFEVNDSIYRLNSLNADYLVLGTSNGLFVVHKQTGESMSFATWTQGIESLTGQIVLSIEADWSMPGRLWFGTNKGLYYWQPGMKDPVEHVLALGQDAPSRTIIFATLRDSLGRLWLSGNRFFGYLDEQGQYVSKLGLFAQEIPSKIGSFLEVSPGVIWFASLQQGLFEYQISTDSLHSLTRDWQLDCDAILSMVSTKTANFILCNAILVRQDKTTGEITTLDQNDGFISDEFNEGSVFYRQDKGLYLGSPDGAMLVEPNKLQHRQNTNRVFLESVSVYYGKDTHTYLRPQALSVIEPGANLISFQLSSTDYLDDTPLTLQYRILKKNDPSERPFLLLEDQSQLNISGLNAGEYTLEIKHKNNGVWVSDAYRFDFELTQNWWQSQWFKWLVSLCIFIAFISMLWYRHRQVERFKKINQALVDSDDRLRQALRGSDSDLWEWRSDTQMIYLDNNAGLLGDADFVHCPLSELPVHENDRDRVRGEWIALLEDKGELFESEYRYYRPDGSCGWLRVRGRAVDYQPGTGAIARVAGIYSDISVQRELESEINLLAQAFENTTEGMLILDANETVIISNLAANLIFTTKPNELIGLSLSELVRKSEINLSVDGLLGNGTSWNGERELLRRDKRTFPAWINISMMKAENSLIKHYVLVFSDISERKQNELNLRYLANNDVLTGLANRAMFTRRLTQIISFATLNDEKLALLFLDLDRFKHVNDSYGHSMGDALLVEAARRLQSCLTENHLVCRFGGDEFVILLRDAGDIDGINHVADSLLKTIEQPFKLEGREFFISTSIGISVWPDDSIDPETLIKNADLAMYHAKEEGRGNFQYYSSERNAEALYHLRLEADLRKAIERDEFTLNYQPQVDILHQDRVVGVEALIRWHHPEDGLIRPDIFIKVAESCGLIVDIDRWVFKQACQDAARWHTEFEQSYKLSVNVSAVSFRQADFIDGLKDILTETGMPASLLTVEITEGVLMKELHVAKAHLRKLKALGVKVSIDDFGTGYSSLAYLRHFEVNSLKIDRSFLIDIGVNKADQAIVSSIVELARNLKLEVVAEGVESHEQLEQVFSRGCYLIQGYYFAKPMARNELEIYLGLDS